MGNSDDAYEAFSLVWTEFTVQVEYQRHWLSSGNWHIQLRCDAPLPVTSTGYRSIFMPDERFADAEDIRVFVIALLDEAAEDKAWQRHVADRLQLKLF